MNLLTLIVGQPSTGKTTSLRNLGKDAIIINCERKELPFLSNGAVNYPLGKRPATPATDTKPAIPAMSAKEHMNFVLDQVNASDKFKYVIIDSFSAYADMIMAESKAKYKGWDVMTNYNTAVYDFFEKLKELRNKFIFVISHVEYLSDADGNTVIRTKVKGKEWEGLVEKEATCVLYSRFQKKETGNGVIYQFVTNSDGYLPGKTPMNMFDTETQLYVDNDLKMIIDRYREFYKLDENLKKIVDVAAMV